MTCEEYVVARLKEADAKIERLENELRDMRESMEQLKKNEAERERARERIKALLQVEVDDSTGQRVIRSANIYSWDERSKRDQEELIKVLGLEVNE